MKRSLALAVGLLLLIPATAQSEVAQASQRPPGVTPKTAKHYSLVLLRRSAGWRYRDAGYVDCRRGKINRITWVCRVAWVRGKRCLRGRVRVAGLIYEGRSSYNASFQGRRYRCRGVRG